VFVSTHELAPRWVANVRFYAFFQHFYAGSGLVLPSTAQVVRSNRPRELKHTADSWQS